MPQGNTHPKSSTYSLLSTRLILDILPKVTAELTSTLKSHRAPPLPAALMPVPAALLAHGKHFGSNMILTRVTLAAEEHLPRERGKGGQLCPTHMLLCVMSGYVYVCVGGVEERYWD